jgi:hypothetical protein
VIDQPSPITATGRGARCLGEEVSAADDLDEGRVAEVRALVDHVI